MVYISLFQTVRMSLRFSALFKYVWFLDGPYGFRNRQGIYWQAKKPLAFLEWQGYMELYRPSQHENADDSGRAVWGMNCLRSLEHWDRGFEYQSRNGCLFVFILCLLGSGLATGWSLVQGRFKDALYSKWEQQE
jgi:hypothetical protein